MGRGLVGGSGSNELQLTTWNQIPCATHPDRAAKAIHGVEECFCWNIHTKKLQLNVDLRGVHFIHFGCELDGLVFTVAKVSLRAGDWEQTGFSPPTSVSTIS